VRKGAGGYIRRESAIARERDRDRFESDKQFSDVNLIGSATCKLRRPDVH